MDDISPGDHPGPATPADRRRRRRQNILVFSLFLLAVVGLLVGTVLSVNHGRNYRRLVRSLSLEHYLLFPPPAPRLQIDRQKRLSPTGHYPAWLIKAALERAARFQPGAAEDPEERCQALRTEATTELVFTPIGRDWECLAFEEFGSAPDRASVFVQAKGNDPDQLRSFRLKLSLTDPAERSAVNEAAMRALDRFGLGLSPESRQYLADKLAGPEPFSATLENFKAGFSREMLDERRFNLVLLPRLTLIRCDTPDLPGKVRAITSHMTISCLDYQSRVRSDASVRPDPTAPGPDHPPVPALRPEQGSSDE
jgi:hypothetical protein